MPVRPITALAISRTTAFIHPPETIEAATIARLPKGGITVRGILSGSPEADRTASDMPSGAHPPLIGADMSDRCGTIAGEVDDRKEPE
jgi:hypothetical protein